MQITALDVRNFRCFKRFETELFARMYLAGPNGSGKTSLLEAIAIATQLRSFRTPHIREAIGQGMEAFALRLTVTNDTQVDQIRVGYGAAEKRASINNDETVSRSELARLAHVVPITEDAMELIQGFPEGRRTLFDQIACRRVADYRKVLIAYQKIARQRAALLYRPEGWNAEVYRILTEQIWNASQEIRRVRQEVMYDVEADMRQHAIGIIQNSLTLAYIVPTEEQAAQTPAQWCDAQSVRERQARRSLLGAHLDDIEILVDNMPARRFASRGMQKLLVVLLKLAQVHLVGRSVILLDDIMSDFDEQRARAVVQLLVNDPSQLIFTVPMHEKSPYAQLLLEHDAEGIKL